MNPAPVITASTPLQPARLQSALRAGLAKLAELQGADGSWRGDYGGPMFLLPMYVAGCYFAGREIPAARRAEMVRYLLSVQLPDGGIGLHADGERGVMFTSALTYVALRILGEVPESPAMTRLRSWIHVHGTPLGSASWGKWILALLNVYDYRGITPLLPELYLLPYAVPLHPARFWCHTRQVYLPAAYLYGVKARIAENDLVRALRTELYHRPYAEIPFERYQTQVSPTDQIVPERWPARLAAWGTKWIERLHIPAVRRRALAWLHDQIEYEDRTTEYHRIGPVNAVLNTLVHVERGASAEVLERSWTALDRYLQQSDDGLKMNGYLSTSLWDTAFATQAIMATPQVDSCRETLDRAGDYIRKQQIRTELTDAAKYYRDPVLGGWPFCDIEHGWPITDCTAEGVKATLGLQQAIGQPVERHDLDAARAFMLKYQNADGGWATYERTRGGAWLEAFNPSQVFADIVIDYSFVECTSACMQALAALQRSSPERSVDRESQPAIERGQRFLLKRQRPDGSWEGSWGICFTYGTWFGVRGLLAAGMSPQSEPIQRAVRFLVEHQHADGGWGEHYTSCLERRYVPLKQSTAVNTAWALLTLVDAGAGHTPAAHRAAEFLVSRQQPDGDWPREPMTGIFNRTSCINYENYRRYFPIWALGAYVSNQR